MSENHNIVELRNVSKTYGALTVVSQVSFHIQRGEFISILGPSGSGKSTILKMMSGIVEPAQGEIQFLGQPLSTTTQGDQRMVMVWQSLALFPHMNVEKNVSYGLSVRGMAKDVIRANVADSLELVGLEGYHKRRINQLSGGEQQRVAIARALVVQPEMILLDEPFGALDVHLRKHLLEKVREIHRTTGITFAMVTHDQAEALYISSRTAVLQKGVLQQFDTPDNVLKKPKTVFVADFVGKKNVLAGTLRHVASAKKVVIETSLGEFSAVTPPWLTQKLLPGEDAAYVIESHKVRIGTSGEIQAQGWLSGRVLEGGRETLEVRVTDQITLLCERSSDEEPRFVDGEAVTLSWSMADAYVMAASRS